MSSHVSYRRFGKSRCHGTNGGFRLNPRRFSVQGLRARFYYLFKLLTRWRSSYARALRLLKIKGLHRNGSIIKRNNSNGSSWKGLVATTTTTGGKETPNARLRSFARSNSFYAEAIADCLEFIKRSSISVDQTQR